MLMFASPAGHSTALGSLRNFGRQLLDRRRHGRREEQGLPRLGQLRADFLDVGDEAHVEHPVGFVDDQQLAAGEQILPRPNRSISRPGVAIRTSTPFSSALTWSPICTPPISSAIESV
jgi:hypothetical protein